MHYADATQYAFEVLATPKAFIRYKAMLKKKGQTPLTHENTPEHYPAFVVSRPRKDDAGNVVCYQHEFAYPMNRECAYCGTYISGFSPIVKQSIAAVDLAIPDELADTLL